MYFTPYLLMLVVLIHLATAALLYKQRHAHPAGTAFAWFVLGSAGWTTCVSILALDPHGWWGLWLARGAHGCAAVACAGWVWFCARFPYEDRRHRHTTHWLLATCAAWFAISWTPWIIPAVSWRPWGIDAVIGPLMPAYTIWIILAVATGMVHLGVKAGQADAQTRTQLLYIMIGIIGLLCSTVILNFLIPLLSGSFRLAQYSPFASPFASLFVTVTTTYAILRHQLLAVRIVIRNGLIVLLTLCTFFLLFVVLHGIFTRLLGFTPQHSTLTLYLVIAALFVPALLLVRDLVDRAIFRLHSDYRLELQAFDRFLSAPLPNRDAFCATLVNMLIETLHPRHLAIYLRGDDDALELATQMGDWGTVTIPLHCPLAQQHTALEDFYAQVRPNGIAAILPFYAGDHLWGILFLGPKTRHTAYTPNDLLWLHLLGRQAAITYAHLRQQTEQLRRQEYARVQAQFFSFISHEMKNPLTPILTGIELLQFGDLGPATPRQAEVIAMISRQSNRLHHLMNDLLDLMQMENGALRITPETLAPAPLIAESVDAYAQAYQDKGLQLRSVLTQPLPDVRVDRQRFGQMLDNLLDNARKYTDRGGATVTATAADGWVCITVADTGHGLPAEELPLVFNQAYRAQQHHRIGGAGLGLAIVKHLAEAHGGTVHVASAGLGQGCTFTLTLPVAAPVAAEAAAVGELVGV